MLKRVLKILAVLGILTLVISLVCETLLEPKFRSVAFEGVPASDQPPDVTFMIGAQMDPPVRTNPFLQIFSPLENLTGHLRMVSGSIQVLSDRDVIFLWDIFGSRSVWQLDRHARKLTPLLVQPPGQPTRFGSRIFPCFVALLRSAKKLQIRKSDLADHLDLNLGSGWVEMEIQPKLRALWPRRAKSS